MSDRSVRVLRAVGTVAAIAVGLALGYYFDAGNPLTMTVVAVALGFVAALPRQTATTLLKLFEHAGATLAGSCHAGRVHLGDAQATDSYTVTRGRRSMTVITEGYREPDESTAEEIVSFIAGKVEAWQDPHNGNGDGPPDTLRVSS